MPVDKSNILCSILTFDVQLGLLVDQLSDDEARQKHSLYPQFTYMGKDIIPDAHRIKSPPGPIALEICRESRILALHHYEPMFPSRPYMRNSSEALNAVFDASGWGQARTWVNPKLDLIFLSCMSRALDSPYAPVDIQMLWCHCRPEHTKLERVGAMSHNNSLSPILSIRHCTALKELVIYLTDREEAVHPLKPEDADKYWDEELVSQGIAGVLAEARDKFNSELEQYKKEMENEDMMEYDDPWSQPIPKIKVSQEIHWYVDSETRLKLRLAPRPGDHVPMFQSP